MIFWLVVFVILIALIFDFINGFHDTANAVATVISTGVLPARTAILLAAILNFAGAFWSIKVADFISKEIVSLRSPEVLEIFATQQVDPAIGALIIIMAGLLGACFWNLLTWYFGIPSSSSHALLGGVIGAAWFALGSQAVKTAGLEKALMGLLVSPLAGMVLAFFLMVLVTWIARRARPAKARPAFRWLQLISASSMAFSHGTNDAQKAMGIISLTLATGGFLVFSDKPEVPFWVKLSCATAMMLGTALGGYRIIRTMGHKIIALQPIHGFVAETVAAAVIQVASAYKFPVSTTHIIAGSIMGVGASKRFSAVRWGVAGNIVTAWVLTIPVCALLSGGLAKLLLIVAAV